MHLALEIAQSTVVEEYNKASQGLIFEFALILGLLMYADMEIVISKEPTKKKRL